MQLQNGSAEEAGLDPRRLQNAYDLLASWAADGKVGGSAMAVARHGILVEPHGFGINDRDQGTAPVSADAVFLVASVTKPVTATAAMILVERGLLSLQDRVGELVPEFAGADRAEVRLLHLLTHTSGLPDMLPENIELRRQHAPLAEFIARTCRTAMLFAPGTRISYQSMGTALVGEIVERVSGLPLRQFYQREICGPLGMTSTALGIRQDLEARLAPVTVPAQQQGTNWHWNTPYWRNFGAPWGGMFSTVGDLVIFLQTMLQGGEYGGCRLLGTHTVQAMIRDQTSGLPGLEEGSRRSQAWGLGWNLKERGGDLCSGRHFGHSGATGTLVGADPETGLAWAIFTTQPGAPLHYVANAINGAVL